MISRFNQEQRRQFYQTKADQYAQMLKTLDPTKNLPQASHGINQNMTKYAFPSNKVNAPPKPYTKEILQQITLQQMVAQGSPTGNARTRTKAYNSAAFETM